VGTIRVHCEARDPCHAPQISHPIPRAERFLPTCVTRCRLIIVATTRSACGGSISLPLESPIKFRPCAPPPVRVAPCRCAPTVMPTTRAILEDDGCVAPWWLSLCVMRRLIRASLRVCVCRCGTFVSVAVLLALQFIMSAATCLRLLHGRSVSSCPSTPSRSAQCLCVCAYVCACACCCRCGCGLV
jgi:hypothetical protein